jgi:hypothetical protein
VTSSLQIEEQERIPVPSVINPLSTPFLLDEVTVQKEEKVAIEIKEKREVEGIFRLINGGNQNKIANIKASLLMGLRSKERRKKAIKLTETFMSQLKLRSSEVLILYEAKKKCTGNPFIDNNFVLKNMIRGTSMLMACFVLIIDTLNEKKENYQKIIFKKNLLFSLGLAISTIKALESILDLKKYGIEKEIRCSLISRLHANGISLNDFLIEEASLNRNTYRWLYQKTKPFLHLSTILTAFAIIILTQFNNDPEELESKREKGIIFILGVIILIIETMEMSIDLSLPS